MTAKEREIFRHLMARYKDQWNRNQYNRTNYDGDLEKYLGYRDPSKYPLAYSESFNKILPSIYSILARFMDQMYQTSNIVSVAPRKSKDVNNAKKVESLLNFQMENLNDIDMQGGSYLQIMKWFFNTMTFGKGIAKCFWRKEERIGPKRQALQQPSFDRSGNFQGYDTIDHISMETQIAYDGPYLDIIHNKQAVPHPEYNSIQLMPAFFIVYKKPIDHIKRLVDKRIYDKKNLKELGGTSSGGGASGNPDDSDEAFITSLGLEGALTQAELDDKLKTSNVDIIECYTKLILQDNAYTVGSGVQIKGLEEEAIVHIGNYRTILSIQKNPYGFRPFFDMGWYMQPEMYWDIGVVRLTKGIQEQLNNLANLQMQNINMGINTMIRVDPASDIDPAALVWKPFGVIPAEEGEIEIFGPPFIDDRLFRSQEDFYDRTIQDLTGMYDFNLGRSPVRQERVGVVQGIQQMGEARAKLMLMSMDYLGIRPLLKFMMVLNTFHLPSGFEFRLTGAEQNQFSQLFSGDIHPEFDFAARYTASEPALGKQFRAQQLVQMAAQWQQNPWINQYQMLKTQMELMDIREADSLIKRPEQFQQEMQQQQQQQMMAEQAKQRFWTEGKLTTSDKDFKEQTELNQQEFGHNIAMETLKAGLENEGSDKTVSKAA